jgi:hypothetical protein
VAQRDAGPWVWLGYAGFVWIKSKSRKPSDAIAGYEFGNFVISVAAGLVTYVTLRILDVPFAVPLAILFGFFGLIPLGRADRHPGSRCSAGCGPRLLALPAGRRWRRGSVG